jgi:hypothetical protein
MAGWRGFNGARSMPLVTRLVIALGLLFGFVVAWVVWLERWKARNGIARTTGDGDNGGGDGWLFGGSDGCAGDGGGDSGGACD